MLKYDYLVVGSGIIGMTIAFELKNKEPNSTCAKFMYINDYNQPGAESEKKY